LMVKNWQIWKISYKNKDNFIKIYINQMSKKIIKHRKYTTHFSKRKTINWRRHKHSRMLWSIEKHEEKKISRIGWIYCRIVFTLLERIKLYYDKIISRNFQQGMLANRKIFG
jgi:hypothetical protein